MQGYNHKGLHLIRTVNLRLLFLPLGGLTLSRCQMLSIEIGAIHLSVLKRTFLYTEKVIDIIDPTEFNHLINDSLRAR